MPLRRLPNRRRWQPFVTCRRLCTNSIHANERVLLSGALRQRHLVRCANGKQSTSQGAAPSKDSANRFMKEMPLYPLRFEPIYQYRPWGGRRVSTLLAAPLPGDGPIGEAWLLSDRDEHSSVVADGPLEGKTIGQRCGGRDLRWCLAAVRNTGTGPSFPRRSAEKSVSSSYLRNEVLQV